MPRPIPESITHASVVHSALDDDQKRGVVELLEQRGHPPVEVYRFVSIINAAVAGAYILNPAMSTNSQRREWFLKVHRSITKMRKLLACGDENQTQDLQIWRSEDLQTLDTELLHFLSENNNKTDESPLVRILDHLAETCKTRKAELRPGRKKPGPRQQLANELAWQWKHAFRDAPTAWSALAKDDRDTSPWRISIDSR